MKNDFLITEIYYTLFKIGPIYGRIRETNGWKQPGAFLSAWENLEEKNVRTQVQIYKANEQSVNNLAIFQKITT